MGNESSLVMIHNWNKVSNTDSLEIQITKVDDSWCLVFIHTFIQWEQMET
jgi:hypothetical protein